MRDLFVMSATNPSRLELLQPRQGFGAVAQGSVRSLMPPANPTVTSGSPSARIKLSPDKARAIGMMGGNSSTGITYWIWKDTSDLNGYFSPFIPFSGVIYGVDISNEYYALAGNSPFLYVFNVADDTLVPLSLGDLGRCTAVSFSPDGSKLAVCRLTSPYLRVYNTADWSYSDPPVSAGADRECVGFTEDGNYIVTTGSSQPYISSFKSDLSETAHSSNSSEYASRQGCEIVYHPSKPGKVICSVGFATSSIRRVAYEYDPVTGVTVDIMPKVASISCVSMVTSKELNQITLSHSQSAYSDGSSVSVFDATSYVRIGPINSVEMLGLKYPLVLTIVERDCYEVSGTVRSVENNPVARTITAHDRVSGDAVARTTSNAITGDYLLKLKDDSQVDIQFHAEEGELLNDLFFARVIPKPVA